MNAVNAESFLNRLYCWVAQRNDLKLSQYTAVGIPRAAASLRVVVMTLSVSSLDTTSKYTPLVVMQVTTAM